MDCKVILTVLIFFFFTLFTVLIMRGNTLLLQ
nr:MAG TPA: hypothetical protein [Caudoviricetes sp.]